MMQRRGTFMSLLLVVFLVSNFCALLDVQGFTTSAFGPTTTRTAVVSLVVSKPAAVRVRPSAAIHDLRPFLKREKATALHSASNDDNVAEKDDIFNGKRTATLVGGQSLLIGAAAVAAVILGTPNFGLGPGIDFSQAALEQGAICTLPLFALAYGLDLIEESVPALQDVTKATQRSILALLGDTPKPVIALVTSVALGLAAGFGEEMLFRGVLQYELATRFGSTVGVGFASVVFGALHAVTPLYAILASLASVFFGFLYDSTGNLAVPIVTHAIYDVGALLWAHWTVTQMTDSERDAIIKWKGPMDKKEKGPPIDRTIL